MCSARPIPLLGEGQSAAPPRGQCEDPSGAEGAEQNLFLWLFLFFYQHVSWPLFHPFCCKVSGPTPARQSLFSSSSGSAGAPAPSIGAIQAQTLRGGGTYNQQSGFKYCFREVKDGQVRRQHLLILMHPVGGSPWVNWGMNCGITVCKTICLTRVVFFMMMTFCSQRLFVWIFLLLVGVMLVSISQL